MVDTRSAPRKRELTLEEQAETDDVNQGRDDVPEAKRLRLPEQGTSTSASANMGPSQLSLNKWDTTFIQEEPLTTCIRNNVEQYGGGAVCLKEMLANADDAKATEFTVLLDKATYTTEELLHQNMQDMQTAALLVGNNAVFSEQDFLGYTRKIGNSAKANDSRTVGQFGKGAMTAYSLSDTIQLISGDDIMLLDPHVNRLPNQVSSLRGNLVDSASHRFVDIQQEAPSQMEPFLSATAACSALPTLTVGVHYPGALFRLALRTAETASTSKISQEAITAEDFLAHTLKDFCSMAPDLLLFTRAVSSISVWVRESANSKAVLLHKCSASKQSFPGAAESQIAVEQVSIRTQQGSNSAAACKVWAVATDTASAGGTDGVAALLHAGPAQQQAGPFGLPAVQGRVYATMPLPFKVSGLPVHINGAFSMQSDRRKLWSGEGDRGKGAANDKILVDNVAPAWAALLEALCSGHLVNSPAHIYRLWPSMSVYMDPKELNPVAPATVSCLLKGSKVLWVADTWGGGAGHWVSPSDACFLGVTDPPSSLVAAVGRRAGLLIPGDLPEAIFKALRTAASTARQPLTTLSPAALRKALRQAGNIVKADEVAEVLSYISKDREYSELDQLHLVLLLDGSVQQLRCGLPTGAQRQSVKEDFIMWADPGTKALYQLMQGSQDRLVKDSPGWRRMAAEKDGSGSLLLDNGSMNVRVPTVEDVAGSFPVSWTTRRPNSEWLKSFWTVAAAADWQPKLPRVFDPFKLIPLVGRKWVTPAACRSRPTLTLEHLTRFGEEKDSVAQLLSELGCLCICEPKAYMLSQIPADQEPITLALAAAASRQGLPLHQLISEQHLGTDKFTLVCKILATLAPPHTVSEQRVKDFVRCCTVFEDIAGAQLSLAQRSDIRLLPSAQWEESMADVAELFPWAIVKCHSASPTQKKLFQAAGLKPISLAKFLNEDLLPEVYTSASTDLEPLLLQALDSLVVGPKVQLQQPLQVFVNGRLQRVSKLVDSSSKLLKDLFAKVNGYSSYDLLPGDYAQEERLGILRVHGLAHNDLPDASWFLACADQFVRIYEGKPSNSSRSSMGDHSSMLLDMLQRNVASQDSEDYSHYRMVASTVPVSDPKHGGTTVLRELLGLLAGPQPINVITHLLQTAKARNEQMQNQLNPPALDKHIQEDVDSAYVYIVGAVSQALAAGQRRELAKLTKKLVEVPWVMVERVQRFVAPCDLVFDSEEEHAIQVPKTLLELLNVDTAVKKWSIDKLQITDLQHQAPVVKQLRQPSAPHNLSVQQYLAGSFNNPDAYPDAVMSLNNREIHLHKLVVAKGCEVLAKRWGPLWDGNQTTVALDSLLSCTECSITPSYSTALMFFEFFYTWKVTWPDSKPDVGTALELLVMACVYNVPYLVCEAEIALRRGVTVENCCKLFEVADHHAAQQLRKFCLHFIANGHKLVKKVEGYALLSTELVQEVEQAQQTLLHSA